MNTKFGCKQQQINNYINKSSTVPAEETITTELSELKCQKNCSTFHKSSSASSSTSSSSPRKSYSRRRISNSSKIIFFLYLIFMFLGTTHAITFFYGASGPEGDNDKTLKPFGELSYHEEEMQGPIPDITDDDLRTVYSFCKLLPRLEMIGKVRKSRVTRATCERLIVVLTPMFNKSSSNKPLI